MPPPQETPEQKRRRLFLEWNMGGRAGPPPGATGVFDFTRAPTFGPTVGLGPIPGTTGFPQPQSIEDEIKRNFQLEKVYAQAGIRKPPGVSPLPANPTAMDWKRLNDALASWIRRPAPIPGTHRPSPGPVDPEDYWVGSKPYPSPVPPGGPYHATRTGGETPYNLPTAPWHQLVTGPMALAQRMATETAALATSAVPTGFHIPIAGPGGGGRIPIGEWISTKAEAERLRREQPELGTWQAATQAYKAKDMPWGVKGAMELALDPLNLALVGGAIPRLGVRLGAKALSRAAPGLAAKFAPKAPIGTTSALDIGRGTAWGAPYQGPARLQPTVTRPSAVTAVTQAQAQAQRAAQSIGIGDVLGPVAGAARRVLRRTPDAPVQEPRQLRLPIDTSSRPVQAFRPAAPAVARAAEESVEDVISSKTGGITRYEQSVQRRQVEGAIQEGPLDVYAVESQRRGRGFFEGLSETRRTHKFGAAVEVKDQSFYTDPANRLYLAADDSAGVAVTPDADLVSVFKVPGSTQDINPILSQASKVSRTLDAYDINGVLPNLYAEHGFRPAARVRFNRDFAPEGWAYDVAGEPDIVLMVRDGDGVTGLASSPTRDAGGYASIKNKVPIFDDFDEAIAYRQQFLDKLPGEAPTTARVAGVVDEVTPTTPTAGTAPTPGGGARGPRGPGGPGEQGQLFPEGAVPEGGGVEDILGLRDPAVGLSRRQELANVVRRTIGRVVGAVPEDEFSSAAKVERSRLHPVADNQAAATTTRVGHRLRQVFDFDNQGGIPSLAGVDPSVPGAPTIADVAARFPRYEARLNDEQLKALSYVHEEFTPYRNMLIKAGRLEILHQRTDIIDGGFYIPRGGVDLDWADEFYGVTSGRGMASGGKPGYVRRAKESSQAEGISKGNEYASLDDAIGTFTRGAARTGVNDHIVRFFKGIKDPDTGDLIGTSRRDRVPAELRKKVEGLKGKISSRLGTLKNQLARGGPLNQAFGDIEKLLDGVEKTRFHRARQLSDRVQAGKASDPLTPIMEADVILLERIARRLEVASKKAGIRGTAEANKAEATAASIRQLRDELSEIKPAWKQALEDATGARPGEGFIDLPGLQGYSFPDVMASSMNKQLRSEGTLIGNKRDFYDAFNVINNFYRGMNATMDNSAPGIQGLLAWWSNPKAAATALRTNMRAWHDPDALGAFLAQYDETAKQLDMPSSMEAIRDGVRVMGVETEFQLGRGGIYNTVIKRIPVVGTTVKRADRAFGFYGDSLRLTWYRNMIEDEVARGAGKISIDDLRASGDMDKISSISNRMTGWTEGRAFGSLGDLLLFAPRFLQSRMETVVLGTRGLLPGAPLDARIARRSLVKMIAFGTLTTIAVNEAMGYRMTIDDFKPIKNGKYNSNFMRIHAFGRKWSVFGTWDSLARALVGVGTGEGGNVLRGMGSGLTSNAWDLVTGRDWEGKTVPNTLEEIAKDLDGFALHILEQFTPFAAEEIPFAAEQVVRGVGPGYPGPAAGVAGAGATLVGEIFGLKSYPESFEVSERKSIVGDLNLKTLDGSEPVHDWLDLNSTQKRELIRTNSRLAELDKKIRKDRYERSNDIQRARMDSEDKAVAEFHASMLLAAQNLTVSRKQYDDQRHDARLVYSTLRKAIWGTRQSLEADSVEAIENWLSGHQLPEDVAVNDYFEEMNRLIELEPLGMNTKESWDRVNRGLERFLTVTQNYPLHIIKYVKDNRGAWIDRLPEPLRAIERRREREMSTGVWFRDYNKPMVTTGIPRPAHPLPVVAPVPGSVTPDQQYRRLPYQGVTSAR